MVDIVNSTRTVIGQAACEVLPPLVAALKLSVGNFLEGKFRHFEVKETQNSYSRIVPLVISKTHCQLFSAVGVV